MRSLFFKTEKTEKGKSLFSKKLLIISYLLLTSIFTNNITEGFGQTYYQIGTGTNVQQDIPMSIYYNYSYTQQIYTAAELTAAGMSAGTITEIAFYTTNLNALVNGQDWTVYMGNTTQATYPNANSGSWIPVANMTNVFSGTVSGSTAGWIMIKVCFQWDGTSNIVVAVDENTNGYYANNSYWRYTSTSTNYRTLYYRSDAINPNPASPPTASGRSYDRPNIRFSMITTSAPLVPTTVSNNGPVVPGGTVNLSSIGLAPGGSTANFTNGGSFSDYISTVSNNFTIEFWVNPNATRNNVTQSATGTGACCAGQRWAIYPCHGGVAANNRSGVGISVGTNGVVVGEHADGFMPPNLVYNDNISGWTHVALVYTARVPRLYLNGQLVHTGVATAKTNVYPSIGSANSYGGYSGGIDNIRYWNRSLSAAEINTVKNMEDTPASVTGLIGQYRFNGTTSPSVGSLPNWDTPSSYSVQNYYTYAWAGSGAPSPSNNETQTATTTTACPWLYTLDIRTNNSCNVPQQYQTLVQPNLSGNTALYGDPSSFGNKTWNVYGYQGIEINPSPDYVGLGGTTYYGSYTQNLDAPTNYGFDTYDITGATTPTNGWNHNQSVSNSASWQGCVVPVNNFTFIHKRQGFPCGTYQLTLNDWDDQTVVYVNGTNVWNCNDWYGAGSCLGQTGGSTPAPIGLFELNDNSTIEVRTAQGVGGANAQLNIVPTTSGNLASNAQWRECVVRGNQWTHFYHHPSGNYIASVRGTTPASDLGVVRATAYIDGSVQLIPACDDASYETAVMQRHYVITPSTDGQADVRLPYTDAEFQNLAPASVTSSSPDDLVTYPVQSTVYLSKYSGGTPFPGAYQSTVNNTFTDNCPPVGSGGTTRYSGAHGGNASSYWYSEFTVPGFSEFWLHGNTIPTPLSVQLDNLSASCDNKTITWRTLSEQNSSHFVVEQSRNGYDWSVITTIEGAGTTNTVNNYLINNELSANYYRLKQVDFDGKSEYYGPIHVNCGNSSNALTVYPNPANGTFTVAISSSEELGESNVFVHDVSGKIVAVRGVSVLSGTNTVQFENNNLMPGTYIVSVKGKEKNTLTPVRLVVQ